MAGTKFGCYIFQDGLTFEEILKIARRCERLGLESVWLKDNFSPWLHKWFRGQKAIPSASFLESWTTLSALASFTKKIRIGCVLVNLYRQPSLVAKMASTLDAISDGRLELGLSAGWNREECTSYGIAFPSASTRRKMLAEAVKVMKMLWTKQDPSFRGKHYSLHRALCWPKPVQKPRPTLWIGGSADETLGIAAREADGWIYGLCERGRYMESLKRLRVECDEAGRDWTTITKAWYGFVDIEAGRGRAKERRRLGGDEAKRTTAAITGRSEEVARELRTYLDAGVTYFIPAFRNENIYEQLQIFSHEVIRQLR